MKQNLRSRLVLDLMGSLEFINFLFFLQVFCVEFIDCSEAKENDKWLFYNHFRPFFGQFHDYISQNWGSDGQGWYGSVWVSESKGRNFSGKNLSKEPSKYLLTNGKSPPSHFCGHVLIVLNWSGCKQNLWDSQLTTCPIYNHFVCN